MSTIIGSFLESSRRFPERTAMRYYQDESWEFITYADMADAVRITAAGLKQLGLGDDSKIAIMSQNRPEWFVCYLAIQAVGGIAVPIDANLGEVETTHIINHSESTTILCSMSCHDVLSRIISELPSIENIIIFDRNVTVLKRHKGLGDGRDAAKNGRSNNRHKTFLSYDDLRDMGTKLLKESSFTTVERKSDDLASIIYTSGTTGTPKGVMLTNRNFISNIESIADVIRVSQEDNFLLLLPMHHVFPFTICFVYPIVAGACVSFVDILSRERQRLIMECQPTLMVGVPLLYSKIYRGIIRQIEASKFKNALFKYGGRKIIGMGLKKKLGGKIRYMISGAAPMEPSVIEGFVNLGISFLEGYGITETSPVASCNRPGAIKIGSVGVPIDNVVVKIVNPGADGIGEIAIKGDNVMKGYFKNPEQTSSVIRDGWYHSGDLGKIDEDGYIFITGRAKDIIVNRGGKNVYPEVVESEINKSRFIAESIVLGYRTEGRVGEDVGVLVYPDYEILIEHAASEGMKFKEHIDINELTEDAKDELIDAFKPLLEREVKGSMDKLAPHQRVTRIGIERDEFVKTSTRKIKRFLYKGRLDIVDID